MKQQQRKARHASERAVDVKSKKHPADAGPPVSDDKNPLEVAGGRRSDVDGKFEADHRPSR